VGGIVRHQTGRTRGKRQFLQLVAAARPVVRQQLAVAGDTGHRPFHVNWLFHAVFGFNDHRLISGVFSG
jgi:hypothetical protein